MIKEPISNPYESEPKIIVVSPAVESLFHIKEQDSLWPESVKEDEKLKDQSENRNNLVKNLSSIFSSIPKADMEITEAVSLELVSEKDLIEMYKNIIDLLKSDPYNIRMILYFPFELLPPKSWYPQSKELKIMIEKFTEVYMGGWYELLGVNDVRANFVDGDVLEAELRSEPLGRVTKVAHLIPVLLEKGFLSIPEITQLIEDNPNSTLQKSILDTLPVLVDMSLLSQEELDKIIQTNNLNLDKKKDTPIPPEKITEARAKWLKEKDEPIEISEHPDDQLDMPFSKREEMLKTDIGDLEHVVNSIESDPELNRFLYPAVILFGSRIKGYGLPKADLDIAVFVRPEISSEDRSELKKLLANTFSHEKIKGKVVEFWLKNSEDGLSIIDSPDSTNTMADSRWAHVLFEGAWIGSNITVRELYEKLLSGYLYSENKTINGIDARRTWLEEMEKDTLQYRLMHKGYARFFPKQGGIQTSNSDRIDGQSMFYDSGYRRLATKLFLEKIFLPQLKK